jgi:hypothetical protein
MVAGARLKDPFQIGHALVAIRGPDKKITNYVDTWNLVYKNGPSKIDMNAFSEFEKASVQLNDLKKKEILAKQMIADQETIAKQDSTASAKNPNDLILELKEIQSKLKLNSLTFSLHDIERYNNSYSAQKEEIFTFIHGVLPIYTPDSWREEYGKNYKGYTYLHLEPSQYLKIYKGSHYLKLFFGYHKFSAFDPVQF